MTKHSEFLAKKEQIEQLKLNIQSKDAEINQLARTFTEAQSVVKELTAKISTSNRDMLRGLLTLNGLRSLQEELAEKQAELNNLNDTLQAEKEMLNWMRNDLTRQLPIYKTIQKQLAKNIAEESINEIAGMISEEPFKKMIYALLSAKNNWEKPDDIYRDIGLALCKKIFGEQHQFAARIPDIFESKQRIKDLLENAA